MRLLRTVVLVAVAVGLAAPAFAEDPFYLYQRGTFGAQGDISFESETAYGNRETRLLGEDAIEQAMRLRIAGADWLSFEGWGGIAMRTGADTGEDGNNYAVAGDVFARVLNQEAHYLNLSLGLGYLYDYGETSIPRARLTLARRWGRFDLSFATLAEMPLSGEEEEEEAEAEGEAEEEEEEEEAAYDEVDLMFTLAASYAVADWARLGVESVLEDTEGFWEEEEAEGGAKLLLGPTASFAVAQNFYVRANTAAVIPVTTNQQTRVPGGTTQNDTGFLGRVALGYTFK